MDETSPAHSPPPDDAAARRLARAERVLACFQHTLNHDLPNQLVAIQGLLQILELEESERLSDDGRDYVRRLAGTTQRVQQMVATLKAIGKAASDAGAAEEVSLPDLAREAVAELKGMFPTRAVTYHLRFAVPSVRLSRRLLHRAVVEVLRLVFVNGDAEPLHVQMESRPAPGGALLTVGRKGAGEEPGPDLGRLPAPEPTGEADKLALALVRELADAWGGSLTVQSDPGRGTLYALLLREP
jgi:signal transduction histidine kinase